MLFCCTSTYTHLKEHKSRTTPCANPAMAISGCKLSMMLLSVSHEKCTLTHPRNEDGPGPVSSRLPICLWLIDFLEHGHGLIDWLLSSCAPMIHCSRSRCSPLELKWDFTGQFCVAAFHPCPRCGPMSGPQSLVSTFTQHLSLPLCDYPFLMKLFMRINRQTIHPYYRFVFFRFLSVA